MSRSISDENRATRLKVMFSRSPFASSDDGTSKGMPATSQHKRTNTGTEACLSTESKTSGKKLQTARRHKSYSSLERLRPSSLSKLSMTATRQHTAPSPKPSSPEKESRSSFNMEENLGKLLHHGEVQVVQSSWRKKLEYLVLTDRFLLRFKNSKRAAEQFPWILPINAQMSRPGSPCPTQLLDREMTSGSESPIEAPSIKSTSMPLQSIITVQQIVETHNRVRFEIQFLEDQSHSGILTLFVERINGEPHWLENVCDLARQVQMKEGWNLSKDLSDSVREVALDDEMELNAEAKRSSVYFLNRRNNTPGQIHITDETKESPVLLLLVIARYQMYLIALTKRSSRRQGEDSKSHSTSYGYVNLVSLIVSDRHDCVRLVFRNPQQAPVSFELDSVHSAQIAIEIHERLESLVPSSQRNPFLFRLPTALQSQLKPIHHKPCSSVESFTSTLKAYSLAFGVNLEDINYKVNHDVEDSPLLRLMPKKDSRYSALQLIAVLRALRDNDYFASISLADISLNCLSDMYDIFGDNHIRMSACMGSKILMTHEEMKHTSVLIQELSAMIMSSVALKRLYFSRSIYNIPLSRLEEAGGDRGCGIVEALYPLCINQNTNLDWISLNGIHLSRTDVEFVLGMLSKPQCRIRGLELADCHLDTEILERIIQELPTQWQTLEAIDLSNNQGQLDLEIFYFFSWSACTSIRKIGLMGTKILPSCSAMSILPLDFLTSKELEELRFDRTKLSHRTVETLVEYLATESSERLRHLSLVGCQLQPLQIAQLLRASSKHENLHLDVSENEIDDLSPIIEAISENECPTNLALRLLDFDNPEDFEAFANAIRLNSSIQHLDLSGSAVSFLITDRRVSDSLHALFRDNQRLEFFNISGMNSRLDISNLGGDVAGSLAGLAHNNSLKALHMEHQKLGIEGANIVADVLRQNNTLKELHISHNHIPLSGLTAMVDSLEYNTALTYLSRLDECKASAIQNIHTIVQDFNQVTHSKSRKTGEHEDHSGPMNRRLGTKTKDLVGKFASSKHEGREKDTGDALSPELIEKVIADKWSAQQKKLEEYLSRNIHLAAEELSKKEEGEHNDKASVVDQKEKNQEEAEEHVESPTDAISTLEKKADDKRLTMVTIEELAGSVSPSVTSEKNKLEETIDVDLKDDVSKLALEGVC